MGPCSGCVELLHETMPFQLWIFLADQHKNINWPNNASLFSLKLESFACISICRLWIGIMQFIAMVLQRSGAESLCRPIWLWWGQMVPNYGWNGWVELCLWVKWISSLHLYRWILSVFHAFPIDSLRTLFALSFILKLYIL